MEDNKENSIDAKHNERRVVDAADLSTEPYGPPGTLSWSVDIVSPVLIL